MTNSELKVLFAVTFAKGMSLTLELVLQSIMTTLREKLEDYSVSIVIDTSSEDTETRNFCIERRNISDKAQVG
jgi:hypothetical protein